MFLIQIYNYHGNKFCLYSSVCSITNSLQNHFLCNVGTRSRLSETTNEVCQIISHGYQFSCHQYDDNWANDHYVCNHLYICPVLTNNRIRTDYLSHRIAFSSICALMDSNWGCGVPVFVRIQNSIRTNQPET